MFGGCPFVYTYVHVTCIYAYKYAYKRASGFSCLLENLGFFLNFEVPGNSWKLKLKVPESSGI